jgi:hypothetical protein
MDRRMYLCISHAAGTPLSISLSSLMSVTGPWTVAISNNMEEIAGNVETVYCKSTLLAGLVNLNDAAWATDQPCGGNNTSMNNRGTSMNKTSAGGAS